MDPLSIVKFGLDATRIGFEAQAVITMRLAGLVGLWDMPMQEAMRMVQEKPLAAMEAGAAATAALLAGQGADRALSASMARIGEHTNANMRRLSQRL